MAVSRDTLQPLLDELFAFVGVLSPDGTVLEARHPSQPAPADVVGRKVWECEPWSRSPDIQRTLQEWVERAARGEARRSDLRVGASDDVDAWIDLRLVPVRDETDRVTQLIGTGLDVTVRKRAEESIARKYQESRALLDAEMRARESEHRLQLALEASATGIWEWDLASNAVRWSEQCYEIHGLAEQDFDGTAAAFDRLVHAEDRQGTWDAVRAAIDGRTTYDHAFRIVRPDGAIRWVKNRGRAIYDSEGNPIRMIGTLNDVTASKEREALLRASDERFRLLADAVPQIVWTSDAWGNVTYYNRKWLEYTGLTLEQALERSWLELIHPDHREETLQAWQAAMHTGEPYVKEHRVRRADGEYRWLLSRALPGTQGSSGATLWFGTSTDIEDQKQLSELLLATGRRKDEFLATLAHELRNPLAAIHNAVRVLTMKATAPAPSRIAIDIIERQSRQIGRLVDDLLDISRIGQGKLQLRREWLPIGDIVEQAVEASLPGINRMQHHLDVELPEAPLYVYADSARLCQVFSNLLGNAAKFTEPGGRIGIAVAALDDEVSVTVSDNGIGIAASDLSRVFELFSQVEASGEAERDGLGIGLSLAKGLVTMHGGTIEASSDGIGKGCAFVVRLPAARSR